MTSHLVLSLRLSLSILATDLRRRLAPTYLGVVWFAAPILTILVIAGTPGSITGNGQSPNQLYVLSLIIIGFQFSSEIAFESARLIRRNRLLIPVLGVKSIILNLAGLLSAMLQLTLKLIVVTLFSIAVGATVSEVAETIISFALSLAPIALFGLFISFLFSFLSILILDVRFVLGYFPLILILLVPLSSKADLDRINPVSFLDPFFLIRSINSGEIIWHLIVLILALNFILYGLLNFLAHRLQIRLAGLLLGRSS